MSTLGIALADCLGGDEDATTVDRAGDAAGSATGESLAVTSATLYQGPNCSCCGEYADYLQEYLETDLEVVVPDDPVAVKAERGVDAERRSCHTVALDDYVVEGHVPVGPIATLLETAPAIDGIALPGMPAGAPGMGGSKHETWTIYELGSEDGAVFAEL